MREYFGNANLLDNMIVEELKVAVPYIAPCQKFLQDIWSKRAYIGGTVASIVFESVWKPLFVGSPDEIYDSCLATLATNIRCWGKKLTQ